MSTKKLVPLKLTGSFESIYGNFGYRFAALLLDFLILSPLILAVLYINSISLYNFYYTFIVNQLILLFYYVYLPVKYGATPGKLIMGLHILKISGEPITYRESFLKHLPAIIITLIPFTLMTFALRNADEELFNSYSWFQQSKYIQSFTPISNFVQMGLINVFYLANLFVFLMGARLQSIGDHIASTVVVYKRFLDKIAEEV